MATIKVLEDLTNAMQDYPHVYLTLEIIEVDPPGDEVNKDDDVLFRIRITNRGPLDVNQLSLLVEGLNGTQVKSNGAAAQWADSFSLSGSYIGNIPAHSGDTPVVVGGGKFHFKPSIVSPAEKDLVKISVAGWDTDFAHIQVAHSRADSAAQSTYSSTVAAT